MKPEDCVGCPLYGCEGPVPGELNGEAGWDLEGSTDVLFVSEAPGRHEVIKMRPFANPKGAGGILRQTLEQMGITRFGAVNTFRCRPPNNKLPGGDPGNYCKNVLRKEVSAWNPRIIVPLGSVGLNELLGQEMSIMKVRGRLFESDGLVLLPMLHPAYLLHKHGHWRDWELDMEKLKRWLDGKTDHVRDKTVHMARTSVQALEFLRFLKGAKVLSCDNETTSFNMPWEYGELIAFSISPSVNEAFAVPYRLVNAEVFELLKEMFEDLNTKWLWYNGIFDVQFFWALGIQARIDGDAMLEAHLLDERLNVHNLKKDAAMFLEAQDWEEPIKRFNIPNDTSPEAMQGWRDIPEDELLEYNGLDTIHTFNLSRVLRERLGSELCRYCDDLLVPGYNMLARARRVGIPVDVHKIAELRDKFVPVLEDLERVLVEISGDKFFNPRSWQQKLEVLHRNGLKVPNTRRETLEVYKGNEIIDAMLAYAEAHKMNSTYIEGIVDDICDDFRVHPDWRLPAETGRLRCSDPNILGIPRKAEETEHRWKRLIKEMFIAPKGALLAHLDRKQSEVRVACFLAQDETLAQVLRGAMDLHSNMAKLMYGEGFTKEQRVWAKMVTFGLLYNREAPSLARQLTAIERQKARESNSATWHIWSVHEAQKVINRFFEQMPTLLEWKKSIMHEALTEGELTSFFGRKRRFGLVTYSNRKGIENEAVNYPVSSVSSDLNLISCVETVKHFGKYGVEVLAPIHDAGLLLVPNEQIVTDIVGMWEELPKTVLGTDLPFPVDASVGERWSDL